MVPSEEEGLCPGDHFVLESCGSWWSVSPERYYCGDYSDVIGQRGSFNLVQHYQINATSLRVSFHSDSVTEGRGFLMQYQILDGDECRGWGSAGYSSISLNDGKEADCVAVLDDDSGTFNTPGFPNPYPADTACAYGFKKPSPEYCGVLLRTVKFDLEEKDAGTCHDYWRMPGCRKLCGRPSENVVFFYEYQPGAEIMFLQFESDFATEGRGFKMSYVQVTDCFNPHQPECPNDQLIQLATPSECIGLKKNNHDCDNNAECSGSQVCCWDGCLRSCKDPVTSIKRRKRREVENLDNILKHDIPNFIFDDDVSFSTPVVGSRFQAGAPHVPDQTRVPSLPMVHIPIEAFP